TPAQRTQAAQAALRAQRAADAASARQEGDSRDCADRQRAAAAQVATAQAAVAQASRSSSTPVAASVTSTTSAAGLAATLAANDAAVAQAQAAVDQAQAAVDATVLHAPVDGLVQVVNVVEDAVPPSGAAIQERSDTLTVQANVAEQDVTQIKGGQKAQVTLPALGTTESATVAGLPSQANAAPSSASAAASTAVTFPVTLTFDQSDPAILPGMSAQLEIALVRHANVLQVPTTAVQGGANGSTVQVLQDGRPVTRPVEVGLSTETATEIVVGLREGQTVVTGVVNPTQGATQPTTGGGGFGGGGGARGGGFGGGGGLGGGGGGGARGGGGG
ncbi:MAG TPA: HlyD family efflux transporter periplasmic adaptor subunit, partial [Actinomycetota bacterium]|nr:HlyD family efflux transporter periplasmic adaptor subunit [Actinomycetota bacterium]